MAGTSSSENPSESRTNHLAASTMPTNNDFGGFQFQTHTEQTEPFELSYDLAQRGETTFEMWFGQHLADFDSIFQASAPASSAAVLGPTMPIPFLDALGAHVPALGQAQ